MNETPRKSILISAKITVIKTQNLRLTPLKHKFQLRDIDEFGIQDRDHPQNDVNKRRFKTFTSI